MASKPTAKQQAKLNNTTRAQKIEELYRRGVLVWKLHDVQKIMYRDIHDSPHRTYVINSARRLGKSFMMVLMALEKGFQQPGAQIKFCAPSQKQVRKIILPAAKLLLQDCPKALRPKWKSMDSYYEFSNGSELHIAGSEQGQIDNLRGQACDIAFIDEAGFCSDLEYVIESVIRPQTLTRPGSRIVLASTPPVTPDHPFVTRYMQQAIARNAYSKFTIYDNPMITAEQIQEFMDEAGGADSTDWRREYLAEVVTDRDAAIFPEASDDLIRELVQELELPPFYEPFVAIDLGYVDYTGVIFGYYDFIRAKAVIVDELLLAKCTSAEVITQIRSKEAELFPKKTVLNRVMDAPPLQIADWHEQHSFKCFPPNKADLQANVTRVRMDLTNHAVLIHPRCVNTISQLQYATWDANRRKFSRAGNGGHWDLAAALVYFLKHIDRITNPYPPGFGYDQYNDWAVPNEHPNTLAKQIKSLFTPRRRR